MAGLQEDYGADDGLDLSVLQSRMSEQEKREKGRSVADAFREHWNDRINQAGNNVEGLREVVAELYEEKLRLVENLGRPSEPGSHQEVDFGQAFRKELRRRENIKNGFPVAALKSEVEELLRNTYEPDELRSYAESILSSTYLNIIIGHTFPTSTELGKSISEALFVKRSVVIADPPDVNSLTVSELFDLAQRTPPSSDTAEELCQALVNRAAKVHFDLYKANSEDKNILLFQMKGVKPTEQIFREEILQELEDITAAQGENGNQIHNSAVLLRDALRCFEQSTGKQYGNLYPSPKPSEVNLANLKPTELLKFLVKNRFFPTYSSGSTDESKLVNVIVNAIVENNASLENRLGSDIRLQPQNNQESEERIRRQINAIQIGVSNLTLIEAAARALKLSIDRVNAAQSGGSSQPPINS